MAKCNNVNTPTTDDTQLECEEIVKAICVLVSKGQPFITASPDTKLEDFLNLLVNKLKNQQLQINNLQVQINNI